MSLILKETKTHFWTKEEVYKKSKRLDLVWDENLERDVEVEYEHYDTFLGFRMVKRNKKKDEIYYRNAKRLDESERKREALRATRPSRPDDTITLDTWSLNAVATLEPFHGGGGGTLRSTYNEGPTAGFADLEYRALNNVTRPEPTLYTTTPRVQALYEQVVTSVHDDTIRDAVEEATAQLNASHPVPPDAVRLHADEEDENAPF